MTAEQCTQTIKISRTTTLCLLCIVYCVVCASLVPRPLPAFQCCTLKNGRAWYAKSRVLHDVINALMNVGVQTTPPTQRLDDRRPLIASAFARARPSFSCVLWNYMAPLLALRFRVFFETILPGKRESLL